MFNRSLNTTMGFLLAVLLWPHASVLAQGPGSPFQQRVTGTFPSGSSIRVVNADGSVVCQMGVTSVSTGSGLTGGPITTSGTISIATGGVPSAHIADGTVGAADVNPAQVQLRLSGTCASGSAIRDVDQTGTVTCQSVGSGVTAVTASVPLFSSGGPTPNISVPNVIFDGLGNTAVGQGAFVANTTGVNNTASGLNALASNTTGTSNTASGSGALISNTTGNANTASGTDGLSRNTTGTGNTASGVAALGNNTTAFNNTASGLLALVTNTTGTNNTASGVFALLRNTTGTQNTASGLQALFNNTIGGSNTASGVFALQHNTTGSNNTAIGTSADVASGDLRNATAIGANAIVDASDKIRLGDGNVLVIEGNVPFTFPSDQTRKENFQPVDGEEVLRKLRGLTLTSWNYIGHDPKQFRHYGPMGQEFFAAFGHDAIGTIGSPTTINSGDMTAIVMIAVQALGKHVSALTAENAELKARLDRLERTTARYAR